LHFRPQKDKQHRTWLTVGGDRIAYDGDKSTPTANLVTAKLLVNSTISTTKAQFYVMDLANFYLDTPMPYPEYMRLRLDLIPEEIIAKYDLSWMGLCRNPQRHVWPPPSWYSCQQTPQEMLKHERILSISAHSGPLVTWVVRHHVLSCR
jgi:hypothetical protein